MIKTFYSSPLRRSISEICCLKILNRQLRNISLKNNILSPTNVVYRAIRTKKYDKGDISRLFVPVTVKPNPDDINVGVEFSGTIKKQDLIRTLSKFYQRPEVRLLASENGLDDNLLHQAFISFRKLCLENDLPSDIHLIISDVLQGAGHVDDLFPYFLRHARQVFPHLDCLDDLKKISDLRTPASWYPEARSLHRKIIFHAGPTNSGKTYHALEKYLSAKSGVYCGPLKLLASEIYHKANEKGTPCDLVTGEERRHASQYNVEKPKIVTEYDAEPSAHVACTVEMTSLNNKYEVAVIDEIQLIGDKGRGWAWTRAFLGIQAEEVHLCGEAGAIPLIEELCNSTGELLEIRNYKRLTRLEVQDHALLSLDNVEKGDCIVCFSKNDIYSVSRTIEKTGREVAVIYGSLPPGTKLAQANKFNDPDNTCKVMVATDAIGLGINLSIRRIIFYSLIKPTLNDKGEKEMDVITISQALQIAGRAGRYGSAWETGYVTTYRPEDLPTLKILLSQLPEKVEQAGLHPTAEQMELYAYHLPHATLRSLMDIFVHLCTVDDSLYFMCNTEAFKFLAEMIQHVPLPLRARYVFCCAPINQKVSFVCAMFLKMVRQYSKNEPLTWSWVGNAISWPLSTPKSIVDLVHLEAVFDVLDLYLWLSYRFEDLFPDAPKVRDKQKELDLIIQQGIFQITKLLRNTEIGVNISEDYEPDDRKYNVSRSYSSKNTRLSHSRNADFDQDVDYDNFVDETKYNQRKIAQDEENSYKSKRLSDRLIAQGLLTPKMLKQLQDELKNPSSDDNFKKRPLKKRPRK